MEATLKVYPDAAFTARANRAFLGRVIRYLAGEAGIRQFLDIGTGIPTAGSTHEVAQAVAPESRVVYVDYDRYKSGCARAGGGLPSVRVVPCGCPVVSSLRPRPTRYVQTHAREGRRTIVPPGCVGRPSACVRYTRRREGHGRTNEESRQCATDANANANGACGPPTIPVRVPRAL